MALTSFVQFGSGFYRMAIGFVCSDRRCAFLDSIRIGVAPHLKRVETAPFGLGRHAITNGVFHDAKEHPSESKYQHDVNNDANQLRGKLAGVSIEQSAHRTGNSIPAVSV